MGLSLQRLWRVIIQIVSRTRRANAGKVGAEAEPARPVDDPFPPAQAARMPPRHFTEATVQYAVVAAFKIVDERCGPVSDEAEMARRTGFIEERLMQVLLDKPFHHFALIMACARAEAEATLAGHPTPMVLDPQAPSVRLARFALGLEAPATVPPAPSGKKA